MEPQELRVGNWIYYKGEPIQVTMIGIGGVQSATDEVVINAKFNTPDLTPIPVTIELLELFGFFASYEDKDTYSKFISQQDNYLNVDLKNSYTDYGSGSRYCGCDCFTNQHFDVPHAQYLHELQNIYYSVSGLELPITRKIISNEKE